VLQLDHVNGKAGASCRQVAEVEHDGGLTGGPYDSHMHLVDGPHGSVKEMADDLRRLEC
jgi:hypothetical protein